MYVALLVKDMQFRSINSFVLSRFLEALRYGKAPCSAEIAYLNNSLNSADGLKLLLSKYAYLSSVVDALKNKLR